MSLPSSDHLATVTWATFPKFEYQISEPSSSAMPGKKEQPPANKPSHSQSKTTSGSIKRGRNGEIDMALVPQPSASSVVQNGDADDIESLMQELYCEVHRAVSSPGLKLNPVDKYMLRRGIRDLIDRVRGDGGFDLTRLLTYLREDMAARILQDTPVTLRNVEMKHIYEKADEAVKLLCMGDKEARAMAELPVFNRPPQSSLRFYDNTVFFATVGGSLADTSSKSRQVPVKVVTGGKGSKKGTEGTSKKSFNLKGYGTVSVPYCRKTATVSLHSTPYSDYIEKIAAGYELRLASDVHFYYFAPCGKHYSLVSEELRLMSDAQRQTLYSRLFPTPTDEDNQWINIGAGEVAKIVIRTTAVARRTTAAGKRASVAAEMDDEDGFDDDAPSPQWGAAAAASGGRNNSEPSLSDTFAIQVRREINEYFKAHGMDKPNVSFASVRHTDETYLERRRKQFDKSQHPLLQQHPPPAPPRESKADRTAGGGGGGGRRQERASLKGAHRGGQQHASPAVGGMAPMSIENLKIIAPMPSVDGGPSEPARLPLPVAPCRPPPAIPSSLLRPPPQKGDSQGMEASSSGGAYNDEDNSGSPPGLQSSQPHLQLPPPCYRSLGLGADFPSQDSLPPLPLGPPPLGMQDDSQSMRDKRLGELVRNGFAGEDRQMNDGPSPAAPGRSAWSARGGLRQHDSQDLSGFDEGLFGTPPESKPDEGRGGGGSAAQQKKRAAVEALASDDQDMPSASPESQLRGAAGGGSIPAPGSLKRARFRKDGGSQGSSQGSGKQHDGLPDTSRSISS
ncbi:unnamed protein product [Vitrella brassicaformis CCMP3155]|uniref:Uncharacterized protein n=2 Tax=Vitrella brassicaformis TaxID=1169539 RepID=A0A0G4FNF4_VITBC|nr:unnamed protein product [Vitrella brassicaformis CCMP3155]|eukprot:CEM15779.1 unnamed protein product [Vitrella brassicaformis CCMP3155]